MRRAPGLIWLVLLAACGPLVPATTPPQVFFTPGPPISFDNGTVILDAFAVPVPPRWRVVKISTAEEPLRVVLAAPDDAILITAALSMRALDNTDLPLRYEQTFERDGLTLYLLGQSTDDAAVQLEAIWSRMVTDIE